METINHFANNADISQSLKTKTLKGDNLAISIYQQPVIKREYLTTQPKKSLNSSVQMMTPLASPRRFNPYQHKDHSKSKPYMSLTTTNIREQLRSLNNRRYK